MLELRASAGRRLGRTRHLQAVPFQRKISAVALFLVTLPVKPTAHALRADVAVTARSPAPRPGVGLGTRVHAVPFQCTIRVLGLAAATPPVIAAARPPVAPAVHAPPAECEPVRMPPESPTAHTSLADVAATPISSPWPDS